MANYSTLKEAVEAVVRTNGAQEITGANLQSVLLAIINSFATGYQFMGVATTSSVPPSSPDQKMFYLANIGTFDNFGVSTTGLSVIHNGSGEWVAVRIMPTENSGAKSIINVKGTYITIDTQAKTITVPANTRLIAMNTRRYDITAGTYTIPSVSGYISYTNIFLEKATGNISFQTYNTSDSTSWDNNMWGDAYIWIGCVEYTNAVNVFCELIAPEYIVNGSYYGSFSRHVPNSGVIKLLTDNDTYIIVNLSEKTVTIPSNARVIDENGNRTYITAGVYEITTGSYIPYTNIFVNKSTGGLVFQAYGSWNDTYWNDEHILIGCVISSSAVSMAYLIANKYIVDGRMYGDSTPDNMTAPQIYNTPIKRRDMNIPLRVCCFGSSWHMNTWWYLNKIIKAAGITATMKCFYTGSAYFAQWIDRFENNTSVDCWTSSDGGDWVKTTANFKDTLSEGWDIIAFQQGAYYSIQWNTQWEPYMEDIVSIVKRSCGIDTVVAFNSTWTPSVNGKLSPYENTIAGQKDWQTLNYINTQRFMNNSGINIVAPNGATMWAMRRNAQLNLSGDLATDGLHPDNGLPMYGLAGTWYETYIAPMYGVSFDEIDWLPTTSTQKAPPSGSTWQSISTTQRDIIRNIIKLSLSDRFGFNEL